MSSSIKGHIHRALAGPVAPGALLASGAAPMALPAAAPFSFSALAPLLTLLFVSASAPFLLRAWASALTTTPPFPETWYNTAILVQEKVITLNSNNLIYVRTTKWPNNVGYNILKRLTSCFGRHVHLHERT